MLLFVGYKCFANAPNNVMLRFWAAASLIGFIVYLISVPLSMLAIDTLFGIAFDFDAPSSETAFLLSQFLCASLLILPSTYWLLYQFKPRQFKSKLHESSEH